MPEHCAPSYCRSSTNTNKNLSWTPASCLSPRISRMVIDDPAAASLTYSARSSQAFLGFFAKMHFELTLRETWNSKCIALKKKRKKKRNSAGPRCNALFHLDLARETQNCRWVSEQVTFCSSNRHLSAHSARVRCSERTRRCFLPLLSPLLHWVKRGPL